MHNLRQISTLFKTLFSPFSLVDSMQGNCSPNKLSLPHFKQKKVAHTQHNTFTLFCIPHLKFLSLQYIQNQNTYRWIHKNSICSLSKMQSTSPRCKLLICASAWPLCTTSRCSSAPRSSKIRSSCYLFPSSPADWASTDSSSKTSGLASANC